MDYIPADTLGEASALIGTLDEDPPRARLRHYRELGSQKFCDCDHPILTLEIGRRSPPFVGATIVNNPKSFKELEVSMSERTFESPVFVRAAEGLIQEIACLEDAFDFLDEWPSHRRRIIYETAKRACCRAFDGSVPLQVARDAFAGFARSVKILEDVTTAMPWMAGAKMGQTGGVAA
ncbi:DUF982 domain-containing protein [Mesorhizobium sp. M4B.F.Ca.ET.017.02.2.1]|uniref:DUF982 domain-containing protein n=1 Tax=unclassified Mesorhizobium TaxID=325217 RepID=UPI0032B01025